MSKRLNIDILNEIFQRRRFASAAYLLVFPLAIAACQYEPLPPVVEPKTLDEETRELYYNILSDANAILFSDVIGYFEASDEVTRTRTRCKDRICSTGFTSFTTPDGFSLDNVDLDIQGVRNGVRVVVERGKNSAVGTIVYGGWLDHSFFASETQKFNHPLSPYKGATRIIGYALGHSSGENPSLTDGSAKWVGLMFGRDVGASNARGRALQGDAEVNVDFDDESAMASVKFYNIEGINSRAKYDNMLWQKMEIEQGVFSRRAGTSDYIAGRFFGPDEQEVGGIFERNDIAGAFGGVREAP